MRVLLNRWRYRFVNVFPSAIDYDDTHIRIGTLKKLRLEPAWVTHRAVDSANAGHVLHDAGRVGDVWVRDLVGHLRQTRRAVRHPTHVGRVRLCLNGDGHGMSRRTCDT